jgi:hypothetical protein
MKRTLVIALTVVAVLAAVGVTSAKDLAPGRAPGKSNPADTPTGAGIVVYDPGAPADALLGQNGPSITIGNRFSSRNGNPLSPGSAYFLSFYLANASLGGGLAVLWGPPTGGGGAPAIASFTIGVIPPTGTAGVSFTPIFVGSDFLAGIYLNSGQPSRGQMGLRSASTNGQGFHGMQLSFGGGAGANYASLAGQNAMMRAAGTFIVPVELMEFDIE